ncbi:MAG: methyltransferase [Bacillota bacterium]
MKAQLKDGEQLEELAPGLWLIQNKAGYRFSLDAVLLAGFVEGIAGERIFDLGTGSGIIPLLLVRREPDLKVLGLELQENLADQAVRSVAINGLADKINIIRGDLRALRGEWLGNWDKVVANPPFFVSRTGRLSAQTEKAVARHELEGTLEDFVRAASELLRRKGRFLLVHKGDRLSDLLFLFNQYGFSLSRLAFVYPDQNSVSKLMLAEGVLGIKTPLKVLPGVYIRTEEGKYTEQMEALFAGGNLFGAGR